MIIKVKYQKHEIFTHQIHITINPSFSICEYCCSTADNVNQLVFLYRLASCEPILPQCHNLRHHKLKQQVIWDQSIQVLRQIIVNFLTSEMLFALSNPNSIPHLDGGVHKVVLVLMENVAEIYHSTLTDLNKISVL